MSMKGKYANMETRQTPVQSKHGDTTQQQDKQKQTFGTRQIHKQYIHRNKANTETRQTQKQEYLGSRRRNPSRESETFSDAFDISTLCPWRCGAAVTSSDLIHRFMFHVHLFALTLIGYESYWKIFDQKSTKQVGYGITKLMIGHFYHLYLLLRKFLHEYCYPRSSNPAS